MNWVLIKYDEVGEQIESELFESFKDACDSVSIYELKIKQKEVSKISIRNKYGVIYCEIKIA